MDIKVIFSKNYFLILLFTLLSQLSLQSFASQIGVHNVITVAKHGGDFTDISVAVNSISDAGINNRYVINIAPGRYSVTRTLNMRPFINVVGSGIDTTVIVGKITVGYQNNSNKCIQNSKVVLTTDRSELSNLSIDVLNAGVKNDTMIAICVVGSGSSAGLIRNVNVKVRYGENNYGIYTNQIDMPFLEDVFFNVIGRPNTPESSNNYGIYFEDSLIGARVSMDGGEIRLGACSNDCVAVFVSDESFAFINNVTIRARSKSLTPLGGLALVSKRGGFIEFKHGYLTGGDIDSGDVFIGGFSGVQTQINLYHSTFMNVGIVGPGIVKCLNTNNGVEELNADCSVPN